MVNVGIAKRQGVAIKCTDAVPPYRRNVLLSSRRPIPRRRQARSRLLLEMLVQILLVASSRCSNSQLHITLNAPRARTARCFRRKFNELHVNRLIVVIMTKQFRFFAPRKISSTQTCLGQSLPATSFSKLISRFQTPRGAVSLRSGARVKGGQSALRQCVRGRKPQ